eukprot:Blabericola_migrator_1__655@NODE_1163_length_5233_cov_27_435927_g793_i0_p4_GENE_NODE_1163_length_5233_cov_27_435927_g793_i0NODE_1163_length_5233_cov_27_435927_g793_i0_p4_ORF_typecomplete_len141_score11_69_NODE_1163_length_5233_cov_27_435927_g793_i043374759
MSTRLFTATSQFAVPVFTFLLFYTVGTSSPMISPVVSSYLTPTIQTSFTFRWTSYMGRKDPVIMAQWIIATFLGLSAIFGALSEPKPLANVSTQPTLRLRLPWAWIASLLFMSIAYIVVPLVVCMIQFASSLLSPLLGWV